MDKENAECGLVDHYIGNHYASESPLLLLTFSLIEVRAQKQMNARRIFVEIEPICTEAENPIQCSCLLNFELHSHVQSIIVSLGVQVHSSWHYIVVANCRNEKLQVEGEFAIRFSFFYLRHTLSFIHIHRSGSNPTSF